jgi:type II secretion system protein N
MKSMITAVIHTFRYHKLKIAFFLGSVGFCLLILFPFNDVGDLVTSQVAKMTNNQIYVQFQEPGLSIFPGFGIKLHQVHVETPLLPPLQADSLSIYPSITSLLALKPGMSVHADGLMGGDVDMTIKQTLMAGKVKAQSINLDGENIDLGQLMKLAPTPIALQGKVRISTQTDIDPLFNEQPVGTIELQVNQFVLPSEVIATPLGPLALPSVALRQVQFDGVLREGRLQIDRLNAGQPTDELSAQVKGRIDVRLVGGTGSAQFIPGSFDFEIRLNTLASFQQKAGLFLSFLSGYKKGSDANSTQYAFRITGQNFYTPPRLTPL